MPLATHILTIRPENSREIPKMAEEIDYRCQRLKIALFRTIHFDGNWSTLNIQEFKPIIERIKTLKHLVKIVLHFDVRISELEEFDRNLTCRNKVDIPNQGNILAFHPCASQYETNVAAESAVQLLDQLFSASLNVRALSIKAYPMSKATVAPLAKLIKNASQLQILKVSHLYFMSMRHYRDSLEKHQLHTRRECDYSSTYRELGVGYDLEQFYQLPSYVECSDAMNDFIKAARDSQTIETLGILLQDGDGKANYSNNNIFRRFFSGVYSYNYTMEQQYDGSTPDAYALKKLYPSFKSEDGLITNQLLRNKRIHHFYFNSPYLCPPEFQKNPNNERFFAHVLTCICPGPSRNFINFGRPLLGDRLLIPIKAYSYSMRQNPHPQSMSTEELFYLVSHEDNEGAGLNKLDEMLRQGVSVNTWDAHYDTPLHKAAENGNVLMVKFLLKRGAYIMLNKELETPIDIARKQSNAPELLKAFGVAKTS